MEKIMENKRLLKIICVALAAILWFYVSYQENPSMSKTVRNVPVTIIGEQTLKENGFAVLSVSEDTVDVKATAKRLSLARINNSNLTATINVASIKKAGTHTIPALVTSNHSSGGSFYTKGNDLQIVIEPIINKSFKIEKSDPVISEPWVKLKSFEFSDDTVKVSAPKSIMSKVGSIRTETVIPGKTNGRKTVKIVVYSKDGKILKGVDCEPASVTVEYKLYNIKRVPIILKTTDNKKFNLPEDSYVEIYGDDERFEKLTHIETQPVDLSQYEVNSTISVELDIPEEYATISSGSSTINITLKEDFFTSN